MCVCVGDRERGGGGSYQSYTWYLFVIFSIIYLFCMGFIVYGFSLKFCEELLKLEDFATSSWVGRDCNTHESSCEDHMLKFKSLLCLGLTSSLQESPPTSNLWATLHLDFCVHLPLLHSHYIYSLCSRNWKRRASERNP